MPSGQRVKSVVVSVTPSIVMQMDENMAMRWKARCPLCKEVGRPRVWQEYAPTRTAAENKLNRHLRTHNVSQGVML